MALKIIHDSFAASVPTVRGPMIFVAFEDADTGQEDVFMFVPENFKEWLKACQKVVDDGGFKPASLADLKNMTEGKS